MCVDLHKKAVLVSFLKLIQTTGTSKEDISIVELFPSVCPIDMTMEQCIIIDVGGPRPQQIIPPLSGWS